MDVRGLVLVALSSAVIAMSGCKSEDSDGGGAGSGVPLAGAGGSNVPLAGPAGGGIALKL